MRVKIFLLPLLKVTVIFFLVFNALSACASWGLGAKFIQIRPTGIQGFIMEKKFTGELLYIEKFDEGYYSRTRVGLCYANLKSRLDTFHLTALAGDVAVPGYQVIHLYRLYFISAGFDFPVLKKKSFYLYPGVDFILGGVDMDYDIVYEITVPGYSFTGGEAIVGFRFRIGFEYAVTDVLSVFIEANRNLYLTTATTFLSHNDIGFGITYYFNEQ